MATPILVTTRREHKMFKKVPNGGIFDAGQGYLIKTGSARVLARGLTPQQYPPQSGFTPVNQDVIEISPGGFDPIPYTYGSTPGEATLIDADTPVIGP